MCLVACGGSTPPAESASSESDAPAGAEDSAERDDGAEADASESEEVESTGIPTKCAKQTEVCQPPQSFVKRLCQDVYPGVALVMFRAGTPWTRAYLTRKTEAWNASGGASLEGWLEFDEEVLVLKERKAGKGGMQVSGAGTGYDALRLNGSCVTLSGEEVTLKSPPSAKYPKLDWRYIDDSIQEALREDEAVTAAYRARRQECKGVAVGTVSKKCVTADQELSDAIIDFLNSGRELPEPDKLP